MTRTLASNNSLLSDSGRAIISHRATISTQFGSRSGQEGAPDERARTAIPLAHALLLAREEGTR